jgi:hypothetical protein
LDHGEVAPQGGYGSPDHSTAVTAEASWATGAASAFHLGAYVAEEAFRFNERRDPDGDGGRFGKVLRSVAGRRIDYKSLTGQAGHGLKGE